MGKLPVGNITLRSVFRWKIENFSRLSTRKHYSDIFLAGSHKWRLVISNNRRYLSMYLDVAKSAELPYVEYKLAVVNQINWKRPVIHVGQHQYNEQKRSWGYRSFMRLSKLNDPHRGYIVNDTCIVECEVVVPGVMENLIYDSKQVLSGKSTETEPQVGMPMEVIAPVKEMNPVAASVRINEPVGVVESTDEVTDCMVRKQLGEITHVCDYLSPGQLFEEGRHQGIARDEKFEDIGGFSVLKTQAPLYKQIWLRYGHIASSQVFTGLHSVQVSMVTEIMTSIIDMHHLRFAEVSSEMIDSWENKINAAEKLEFNIRWLRESFEDVKRNFYREQRLKDALQEQDQAKRQLITAEKQLNVAKIEVKKVQENLSASDTKISALLSDRRQDLETCSCLLLFDNNMSLPPVMVPKQKDAQPKEEDVDNNPSKTKPDTGSARETRPSKSTSVANAEKRKSANHDGKVDGDDEPSKKKVKTAGNEPKSSAKDGSTPPVGFKSSRNFHVSSRGAMPSTASVDQIRENNRNSHVPSRGAMPSTASVDQIRETSRNSHVPSTASVDQIRETSWNSHVPSRGAMLSTASVDQIGETIRNSHVPSRGAMRSTASVEQIGETSRNSHVPSRGAMRSTASVDQIGETSWNSHMPSRGAMPSTAYVDQIGETSRNSHVPSRGAMRSTASVDQIGETSRNSHMPSRGAMPSTAYVDQIGETSRNSHVPSRGAMLSTASFGQIRPDFFKDPNVTTEELFKKFWAICHS